MPATVYTLTETTDRTGHVLAVFADREQAIVAARSHAKHRIDRCIAMDIKTFREPVPPGTYEAVLITEPEQARFVVRHGPSGELDAVAWHIWPFDVIEPARPPVAHADDRRIAAK
jgi:hypothetical protein